jgi:hypothetical protein
MDEGKGVALAILGIVALIAVVGLVLLFKGGTGNYVSYNVPKLYPGKVVKGETGQGFPYEGGGAYVAEQLGSCASDEVFIRGSDASGQFDPNTCRAGAQRLEVYHRNNKFFGAEDQTVLVDGFCCLLPVQGEQLVGTNYLQ